MNYYPIENISILDLYLLYYVLARLKYLNKLHRPALHRSLLLVIGFVLLGFMAFQQSHFGLQEFLMNALRVIFYCLVFIVVSRDIQAGNRKIINNLVLSLKFLLVLVLVEKLLQFIGIYYTYTIPGITTNTGPPTGPFRPSGPFDEPSYLAIYLVLNYYIFLISKCEMKYWRVIIFCLIIISQSFTGLAAIPILLLADYRTGNLSKSQQRIILIVGLTLFIMGSYFLSSRFNSILINEDGSVIHRLNGSFELMGYLWQNKLWTGIGLGQWKNWLFSADISLNSFFFMKDYSIRSGVNNALLMNMGNSGIFGVLVMIWFSIKISRDLFFQLIIYWVYFSWGFFFHPLLFLFFAIVFGLNSQVDMPDHADPFKLEA
jgi:hypothetical protein